MNIIENYECFQVVGFEILAKSAKMKKMFENDHGKIGLKMRLKWPYLSQKFR